jgi:1,4-alpha-glucan branching enzyme
MRQLNRLYAEEPALHLLDLEPAGFEWIDASDHEQSVLSFLRKGSLPSEQIAIVCNFTPVPRHGYRVGLPSAGFWRELLNSDAHEFGGSGQGNLGGVETTIVPWNGRPQSVNLTLPPLGAVFLKLEG